MSLSPEWQEFLRGQFVLGSRVKVRECTEPEKGIAPGTTGTLTEIDDEGRFHVRLDKGGMTTLQIGADRFTVEPPETHTLKLYMPLTADIIEYNEYGEPDDEPSSPMEGRELTGYEDVILAALLRERMPEEAERGIMHWYHEDDSVDRKARSVVFTAEERDGKLWGVAECRIAGELTPEELNTLKDYVTGQASDGWGEGFEQREIKVEDGEMYVHLWNSDGGWSIQTEEECFGPKYAEGLPDLCFSVLQSTGELICIKRGESGYYPSDRETGDRSRNEEIAADQNKRLGVTEAQRQAMECGSMFGWQTPGADPKLYENRQQQIGGMTLG